ncbi:MAG: phosphohydrolase [Firmicutes bacterium HGW-Firmicutes-7]|nr:MAG: phosphohydrolase [Firmicutes bacterium HGW-Firmicutes-7]
MDILEINDEEYINLILPIVEHHEFKKLNSFNHHKDSVFKHSLLVSYLSYKIAKKFQLDYISIARGGLLHDFFLYDWRIEGKLNKKSFMKKHGFTHAKEAFDNATRFFDINDIEKDIILKHMFPLNLPPPKTFESCIVTMVDKYVALVEYGKSKTLINILKR